MNDTIADYLSLNREDKARLLMDMVSRMVMHYGFWFGEVRHQMGMKEALAMMDSAAPKAVGIGLNRLSKILGFEMENGLPKAWVDMDEATLNSLLEGLAKNWLVNDGVWFQSVEFAHGMNDAKRCNDSCWAQFSPYEAHAIKRFLQLDEQPGLDGLKKALGFRMYSFINRQSIVDEGAESFVFQMDECRVQVARKRKDLPDYPCKSAGLVEYTYFAREIDSRIRTECIGCPPDDHPDEWFCAWRFKLGKDE